MILNLNGSFSFPPIHQRWVLIELYSGETISASQPRTSLFAVKLLIPYAFLQQHR
jgi:hypothetical protein